MLKIAVVTSSRADYWLLRPLLSKLKASGQLILFVSGEHLEGPGLDKILIDQFEVNEMINCKAKEDSYLSMTLAIAEGVKNFGEAFQKHQQDVTVLLGDRYEIFAAATASYSLKIPIAHIHGGEVTHGALDDGFRHAISKMSGLHFASHEKYKKRLLNMGEMPGNIHTVGAIGLDNLDIDRYENKAEFLSKYNFLKGKEYFLLTLHPETLSNENIETQAKVVIEALDSYPDFQILVTQSNSDPGGIFLNSEWAKWSNKNKNVHFVPVLGDDYLQVAFHSKIAIGNSSSGILEIPYLDRPVLNIGNRQAGRIIPRGVYSVAYNTEQIKNVINDILSGYKLSDKIYGTPGQVSQLIYSFLLKAPFENLIFKEFYDAEN